MDREGIVVFVVISFPFWKYFIISKNLLVEPRRDTWMDYLRRVPQNKEPDGRRVAYNQRNPSQLCRRYSFLPRLRGTPTETGPAKIAGPLSCMEDMAISHEEDPHKLIIPDLQGIDKELIRL